MKTSLTLIGLTLLTFGLAIGGAPRCRAAEPEAVASVIAIRGEVTAEGADAAKRQLALKGPIFRADTIRTGDRGRIQVQFTDKTVISLGRNTTMSVREYEFNPEAKKGALVTNIEEGVFRVLGGAITKLAPEKFKTVTGTATIGIRGSYYMGRLIGKQLQVVFLGGKGIIVGNEQGRLEITRPGFGTLVEFGHEPAPAHQLDAKDINALIDLLTAGDAGGPGGQPPPQEQQDLQEQLPGGQPLPEGPQGGSLELPDRLQLITQILPVIGDTGTGPQPPPPTTPGDYPVGFAVGVWQDTGEFTGLSVTGGDMQSQVSNTAGTVAGALALASPLGGTVNAAFGPTAFDANGRFDTALTGAGLSNGRLRTAAETMQGAPAEAAQFWDWGWWNADLTGSGGTATVPQTAGGTPAGYWVSGQPTPPEYLNLRGQLPGGAGTGTYSGGARCLEVTSGNALNQYTGTSYFLVDFRQQTVNGALNFTSTNGPTMGVAAGFAPGSASFTGGVTNVNGLSPVSSSVNGSFFGPQAQGLGGAFSANMGPGGSRYTGAFGANGN